jgi:outer membrane receptor for ferrienterochelin and colicins
LGGPAGKRSGFLLQFAHQADEGSDRDPQETVRDTLQGKWHTRLTENWSVDLDTTLARSRRKTFNQPERYDRQYDDYRAGAGLSYQRGLYTWSFSGSRFHQDFVQGYAGFPHGHRFGEISIDQGQTVLSRFGRRHWLTAGAEIQRQKLDYLFENFRNSELEATVPVQEQISNHSFFLQDEIRLLGERLILVPGLRYEEHHRFGSELNPKLSASLRTGAATTWRASVGRGFKSPTIRQLYYEGPYRHGDHYVESNPELNPETAGSTNLSVEQLWLEDRLWTNLALFRTDLKNKVVQVDTGRFLAGIPLQSYENVERARIEGAELSFRAGGRRGFFLRGSGGWSRAENRDTGFDLPYVPAYTASLVPGYLTDSGRTGMEATLSGVGSQYRNVANTQRIAAHQLVDLRLWRLFGKQTTAALDLGNIFASDKGDSEFAWRRGRSVGMSLNAQF